MLRQKVELTLNTLLTALRRVGGGDPHPVFAGGLRYIPPSSMAGVNRAAFEELSEFGFTQGDGFVSDFEDVLHILDRPQTEYFAYVRAKSKQYSVLVAVRGRTAVTAVCQGEQVWLQETGEDQPGALVVHLPEYQPARFKPFSLSQDDFNRQEVDDLYESSPARSREARELDEVFQQPYYGLGEFHVARRTGGTRTETQDTLTYLDIDAGRVAIAMTGRPGNKYISVAPGEPGSLAQRLSSLRAGLDD